jgi:hypothetical protein
MSLPNGCAEAPLPAVCVALRERRSTAASGTEHSKRQTNRFRSSRTHSSRVTGRFGTQDRAARASKHPLKCRRRKRSESGLPGNWNPRRHWLGQRGFSFRPGQAVVRWRVNPRPSRDRKRMGVPVLRTAHLPLTNRKRLCPSRAIAGTSVRTYDRCRFFETIACSISASRSAIATSLSDSSTTTAPSASVSMCVMPGLTRSSSASTAACC